MGKIIRLIVFIVIACSMCSCGYSKENRDTGSMYQRVKELVETIEPDSFDEIRINPRSVSVDKYMDRDKAFSSLLNAYSDNKRVNSILELVGTVDDVIQHSNWIDGFINRRFNRVYKEDGTVLIGTKYSDKFRVINKCLVDLGKGGVAVYNKEFKVLFDIKGSCIDVVHGDSRWYVLLRNGTTSFVKCINAKGSVIWSRKLNSGGKTIRVSDGCIVVNSKYLLSREGKLLGKSKGKYFATKRHVYEFRKGYLYLTGISGKNELVAKKVEDVFECDYACMVVKHGRTSLVRGSSVEATVDGIVINVHEYGNYCIVCIGDKYVFVDGKKSGVLRGKADTVLSTNDYLVCETDGNVSVKCIKSDKRISGKINTFKVYKDWCTFSTTNKIIVTDKDLNILNSFNYTCIFMYNKDVILKYSKGDTGFAYRAVNLKNKKSVPFTVLGTLSDVVNGNIVVQNGVYTDIYKIRSVK